MIYSAASSASSPVPVHAADLSADTISTIHIYIYSTSLHE